MFEAIGKEIEEKEYLGFGDSYNLLGQISSTFDASYPSSRGLENADTKNLPEQAYDLVKKFMDKAEALKGSETYDKQVISSDLARACAAIPVETPEMAEKLLQTTHELFSMKSGNAVSAFELETFAKQGRFLGDKKVAAAYVDATSDSFSKLDTPYDSALPALEKYKGIVQDHPEMSEKIFETVSALKEKFPDNPYYGSCCDEIMRCISSHEKVNNNLKDKAKAFVKTDAEKQTVSNGLRFQTRESASPFIENVSSVKNKKPSVKDKASDFIKSSKAYTGGKNLFVDLKNKMQEAIKENPKLFTAGGMAAVFAGIGTVNPQLAAAGAVVMMAGAKAWADKLKEMRGISGHSISAKASVQKTNVQARAIGNLQKMNDVRGGR